MHPPRVTRRPKRSLTVRFPIPRAAATILRSMAVSKDPRLLELGVLAVKFKGNDSIALGFEVEKEPWEKDDGLKQPAQRKSTSEILSHFVEPREPFSSKPERHNTAGKHNNQDVIYASNGLCSDICAAVEKKASHLDGDREQSFSSSSETRSSVVGGISPNFSRKEIARKRVSDSQSEPTSKNQSNNVPPGRILPPLPRRNKKERGSPGLTKSELSKRGAQPMLDMFFDQSRFSAANMLMQLAKNHSSKGDRQEQQGEHSTVDSNKPVMTCSVSTVSSKKTSVVTQALPNKITQSQEVTMEDRLMGSSSRVDGHPPVVPLPKGSPRTSAVHFEQNKPDVASKSQSIHDITPISQACAGNGSNFAPSTLSKTTWSGHHSSPIHLANSRGPPSHVDSMPARTVWSNPSVLSNSQTVHGSLDQMSMGSADTKTTWSNPSVRPHSQSHANIRQTSKGSGIAQTTWSDTRVSSSSPTDDKATETGHRENLLTTWSSNPGILSNAVNVQPQLGLYQQNIARYPVSYVTYPLGFVYPYIALPQGMNTVDGQESLKVKDEAEKREQSDDVKPEKTEDGVVNHAKQELDSSTSTASKNTSTVQWVIPQVQAGNAVQQGQFIDLASSLRYWQQLSLLYRSQFQAAAAQALAGTLQYTASNTSGVASSTAVDCSPNDTAHSGGNETDKSQETQDFNNNVTVGCDKSSGKELLKEVGKSQAEVVGFKCQNSLSSLKQLSSDPRPGKSYSVKKSKSNPGRGSVIHIVEPDEGNRALGTCRKTSSSSDQPLWPHAAGLSEKPERMEEWSESPKSHSPSCSTATSSSDNSSPAPDMKDLFHSTFPAQKPSSAFGEPHGLLRGVERSPAPELSFVHENSIAYMNVRSHCDYGMKGLKKSASRSEEGVHPAKRKKSKKSL